MSVDDLDSAFAKAEVICAATMSEEPLIRGAFSCDALLSTVEFALQCER
jgi:hypothetical protein